MSKLRRGFKTEAKQIAAQEREELGFGLFDPFDPYLHAAHWGIEIRDLTNAPFSQEALRHFTIVNPSRFSAVLIPEGGGYVVIENHTHDPLRRRSTIAHEMSHVILEHDFDILLGSDNSCRSSASPVEEEAAELSGELLIPSEAALRLAHDGWSDQQVAAKFQVSLQMATWRMNGTGARLRARRRKTWFGQAR